MTDFLKDETGAWSSARLSWWLVLLFALGLIAAEALGGIAPVTAGAWTLLGTLATFTLVWTAGPRMAAYLAPQIGKAVQAVSAAVKGQPDRYQDDERGDHPDRR